MDLSQATQLGLLIVSVIGTSLLIIFKLWDRGASGLMMTAYTLIFALFVLVGILFFKVYGKSNKGAEASE